MSDNGKWTKIGSSNTTPITNTQRKKVQADSYYLVVGFEVNYPAAYKDQTHNLDIDYGHAFFYTTKNAIVTQFFSFGPTGGGKVGWLDSGITAGALIKDGYADARQGTPDYPISETIHLFKIDLTAGEAERVTRETELMRQKITSGKQKYTAWINDTCAETAKQILDSSKVKTPSGSGPISKAGVRVAYAVNPYRWRENFVKAGKREVKITIEDFAGKKWVVGQRDAFYAMFTSATDSPTQTPRVSQSASPSNTNDPFHTLQVAP